MTYDLEKDVAIIGIGCNFPGAPDPEKFWQLLYEGKHAISEIPSTRWNWNSISKKYSNASSAIKWSACIDGIEDFDAEFFGVSENDASIMDPQQRLFLQTAWRCIEDAGYKANDLKLKRVGVFVGLSSSEYKDVLNDADTLIEERFATATSQAILANRLSFLFDLKGPCEVFDAACASSMLAIDRAVEQLKRGRCQFALVGACHLILKPDLHIAFDLGKVLSKRGECRPFDAMADGYVRGEGVGVVMLKPLADALNDNDYIYAVIKNSIVEHGGRSNSLTSPNPIAQESVLKRVYEEVKIPMHYLSYVEAHGTATPLGDSIEWYALDNALKSSYKQSNLNNTLDKNICTIGSVKSNIGHLEAASGIASLIKLALSFKNKILPSSLHFNKLNPLIPAGSDNLSVNGENQEWSSRTVDGSAIPRFAGITSLGFGGVISHIILQEAPENTEKNIKKDALTKAIFKMKTYPLPKYKNEEENAFAVWRGDDLDLSNCISVDQQFLGQARQSPSEVALVDTLGNCSYKELTQLIYQTVKKLNSLNVTPEQPIVIILERDRHLIATLFACLYLSVPYVPLDVNTPSERLLYIVEDVCPQLIIVSDNFLVSEKINCNTVFSSIFFSVQKLEISFEKVFDELSEYSNEKLSRLAYVLYTSGSTGQPKGVCISHLSLVNFLLSMKSYFKLNNQDSFLAVSPIGFDISALEIYLPLLSGATLLFFGSDFNQDAKKVIEAINNFEPSYMQATPATWQMLISIGWQGSKSLNALCGGEKLNSVTAKKLFSSVKNLYNMYGPTETTIWSSISAIKNENEITLGLPIHNTRFYVLNEKMVPVQQGEEGELYIGGSGLAVGYHNKLDLFKEKFVETMQLDYPFEDKKIYRTGDWVATYPNNGISFIRRVDNQVKLRGYRIELEEIESVLEQIENINAAIVILKEGELGQEALIAYFVSDKYLLSSEIVHALSSKLPKYMIPARFIQLKMLPMTFNNKKDRKMLAKMNFMEVENIYGEDTRTNNADGQSKNFKVEYEHNEVSLSRLCEIISIVLEANISTIDPNMNLGELGFNSITYNILSQKIEELFFVKMPPMLFYQYSTAIQIIKYLKEHHKRTEDAIA